MTTRQWIFIAIGGMLCSLASPASLLAEGNLPDNIKWANYQPPELTLFAQVVTDVAGTEEANAGTGSAADEAREMAFIAEAINNPLSFLWLGFIQHDMAWYDGNLLDDLGEDAKLETTTLIEPVMSFQLTEEWKAIFRPVIPIQSFETIGNVDIATGGGRPNIGGVDFERETGLGDIVLWNAFSNQYTPPLVWGFGPTIMLPTATDDQLGTGKWSAGPMALAFSLTEKWIVGGVFQHWWSFAGDDELQVDTSLGLVKVNRPDVNLTDVQYVIRYRLTPETSIGCSPNIRYNWETDQLNFPIGFGIDTVVKIGRMPMKIGIEPQYYVAKDEDFGPEWLLRFYFMPVLPSPEWSRNPLF